MSALPMRSAQLRDVPAEEPDFRVGVIDNEIDFAALREEWTELLTSSKSDCLFLTWEWLHTWWTHLGNGRRLFIITVRCAEQLVAIAPLTVRRTWVGPFAVPVLEFAGTGSVGSDYLDFIVRSDCQVAALRTLISFAADAGYSLRLIRAKLDSAVATALSRGLEDRGWKCVQTLTDTCPFIDLSVDSWDSYLTSLRRKHRSNFSRSLRNLERDYEVKVGYVDSEPDRREALRQLVDLHLRRWQRRGGSDAFDQPNLLAFHNELSRLAHERGWLRLLVMKINGVAAAALYGFRYGAKFYYYQSGFDPAFERYSLGLITVGMTIRDAFEEGAAEYDLLHGAEAYKFLWSRQVRELFRLELYPPGRLGRMHRRAALATAATKKFAKRLLQSAEEPV